MDLHAKLVLQDCPFCGGAGLLEEENNWCWYVMCMDCGAQTAAMEFRTAEECEEAARMAAHLWNIGKVVRVTSANKSVFRAASAKLQCSALPFLNERRPRPHEYGCAAVPA